MYLLFLIISLILKDASNSSFTTHNGTIADKQSKKKFQVDVYVYSYLNLKQSDIFIFIFSYTQFSKLLVFLG